MVKIGRFLRESSLPELFDEEKEKGSSKKRSADKDTGRKGGGAFHSAWKVEQDRVIRSQILQETSQPQVDVSLSLTAKGKRFLDESQSLSKNKDYQNSEILRGKWTLATEVLDLVDRNSDGAGMYFERLSLPTFYLHLFDLLGGGRGEAYLSDTKTALLSIPSTAVWSALQNCVRERFFSFSRGQKEAEVATEVPITPENPEL